MMDSFNERIKSEQIKHQIRLNRHANGVLFDLLKLLRAMQKSLKQRILQEDKLTTKKQLQGLLSDIDSKIEDTTQTFRSQLLVAGEKVAKHEAAFQYKTLASIVTVGVTFEKVPYDQLLAAIYSRPFQGVILKDALKDFGQTIRTAVKRSIAQGFAEGQNTRDIVSAVNASLNIKSRQAEAITRTALNHIANTAKDTFYKQNSNIIKGVQWVSTLDGRTSLICAGLDGTIYPLDSGKRPPAHYNCRSIVTPIIKSWQELGLNLPERAKRTRASMNGQVPATITYNQWLKTQPKDFQDEVLGKKRAVLFRKGLSVDKFTDKNGRTLSLNELEKLEL